MEKQTNMHMWLTDTHRRKSYNRVTMKEVHKMDKNKLTSMSKTYQSSARLVFIYYLLTDGTYRIETDVQMKYQRE